MSEIYQLCPQCKGTGKNPRDPDQKCSWNGCEKGLVLWGIIKDDSEKQSKK